MNQRFRLPPQYLRLRLNPHNLRLQLIRSLRLRPAMKPIPFRPATLPFHFLRCFSYFYPATQLNHPSALTPFPPHICHRMSESIGFEAHSSSPQMLRAQMIRRLCVRQRPLSLARFITLMRIIIVQGVKCAFLFGSQDGSGATFRLLPVVTNPFESVPTAGVGISNPSCVNVASS